MCGIFGGHPALLNPRAAELLRHRGPDQQGVLTHFAGDKGPLIMGVTRLNVVDRHDVEAPMQRDGAVICFNGEVYNWRDLRGELEAQGVEFTTQTDTEVVLQAFLAWGSACLDRFDGQFAIAILKDGEIWLARDRLGKKPLYYIAEGGKFAFSSEIKAFVSFRYRPIELCERLEFYFDELTPFENINALPPATHARCDGHQLTEVTRWWHFPAYVGDIESIDDAAEELISVFRTACRLREIADVPITLFLSGGIDSALIQYVCEFQDTYTVQFDEFRGKIDEDEYVQDLSSLLEFCSNIVVPTKDEFVELLPNIASAIEYPVGSFSLFPLYYLSRAARRAGYKVAFSGEGADELFNGYYRDVILLEENKTVEKHLNGAYDSLARKYFGSGPQRVARMLQRRDENSIEELARHFTTNWDESEPFCHNLARSETTLTLQPLLAMADRMSMANGLEVRNPFLDHRVIEFSARVNSGIRHSGSQGKLVIRRALELLAARSDRPKVLDRPFKHGLPAPINEWLFASDSFERTSWNARLSEECLSALRQLESLPELRKSAT